jgi:hypothetical protein
VKSGGSAAAVTVKTGTQISTDLRQSVSVTSSETYNDSNDSNYSVWVYHTEGNMRAGLYVNGYQGYSDVSIIGQW